MPSDWISNMEERISNLEKERDELKQKIEELKIQLQDEQEYIAELERQIPIAG